MILCNITFSLDNDVEEMWLENYKKTSESGVLPPQAGLTGHKLLRLITVHFGSGITYALQLTFANRMVSENFEKYHKDELTDKLCAPFGEKALAFYTALEECNF